MNNKVEYIECDCRTHVLRVECDNEQFEGKSEEIYYMAMFTYGEHNPKSIKDRLKLCWKILTTGEVYSDQLCLNKSEANKLSSFLNYNNK